MQPVQSSDISYTLSSFVCELGIFPTLSAEAERALCNRWRDHHDISAARKLTGGHLRLVVTVARRYSAHGLPTEDLLGEGYVGLMQALCRFDPNRGIRFADYAIWWIRAAIQTYTLRNWSLAKTGTIIFQEEAHLQSVTPAESPAAGPV